MAVRNTKHTTIDVVAEQVKTTPEFNELKEKFQTPFEEYDRLVFECMLMALNEPLPEGLEDASYGLDPKSKKEYATLLGKVIELIKLDPEFAKKVNYFMTDTRAHAFVVMTGLLNEVTRKEVVKTLIDKYVVLNAFPGENAHRYVKNMDQEELVMLPGHSRDELPTMAELLDYLARYADQPDAGYTLAVNMLSKVDLDATGDKYDGEALDTTVIESNKSHFDFVNEQNTVLANKYFDKVSNIQKDIKQAQEDIKCELTQKSIVKTSSSSSSEYSLAEKVAIGLGLAAVAGAVCYGGYKLYNSKFGTSNFGDTSWL